MPTPRPYRQPRSWPPVPYPRSGSQGTPEPTGWRKWLPLIGVPLLILLVIAAVLGGVTALLWAIGSSL